MCVLIMVFVALDGIEPHVNWDEKRELLRNILINERASCDKDASRGVAPLHVDQ